MTEIKLTQEESLVASRYHAELRLLMFSIDVMKQELEDSEVELSMLEKKTSYLKDKVATLASNKETLDRLQVNAQNRLNEVFDRLKLRLEAETDLSDYKVGLDSDNNVVTLVKE